MWNTTTTLLARNTICCIPYPWYLFLRVAINIFIRRHSRNAITMYDYCLYTYTSDITVIASFYSQNSYIGEFT